MLHWGQVKVEKLGGWPDLPVSQHYINIVGIQVLLDILTNKKRIEQAGTQLGKARSMQTQGVAIIVQGDSCQRDFNSII